MPQDTTTPGYLPPSTSPAYDAALDQMFHDLVMGLTGLTGDLVRPRWQPEPPQQPEHSVNWCAFGVTVNNKDAYAYQALEGEDYITEVDETLELLLSFYGPASSSLAERYRAGQQLGQNREALYGQGIAYSECGSSTMVPVLLQQKWAKRVDVRVTFRRRAVSKYPVASLASAQGTLTADTIPVIVRPLNASL